MNKKFQFMAVLLVFLWATTANAGSIVASFTGISGGLTIDGFRFGFPSDDGDNDPSTINFLFDYYEGNGGTASIFQPITRGNSYNVAVGGATSLGPLNANFNIVSPSDFNRTGTVSIDALLGRLLPTTVSVSPIGALTVQGNTLDLLSVKAGPSAEGYFLKLATQVTSGEALNALLSTLDRNRNGRLTGSFDNANLTAVPEPTVLLLLGGGLCMFGYSRKRA